MKLSELNVNEVAPLAAGALALGRAAAPHIARGAKSGYNKLKGAIQTARTPKAPAAPAPTPKGKTGRKKGGAAQPAPAPAAPATPKEPSAAWKATKAAAGTAARHPTKTYLGTRAVDAALDTSDDPWLTSFIDKVGSDADAVSAGVERVWQGRKDRQQQSNQPASQSANQPTPKAAEPTPEPANRNIKLNPAWLDESSEIISSILKLSGQRPITERDNTVGIIKPKQIKTLTESAQIAECGGMMPNSSTSSQPATLNISATASSGDEVANMLKSIMQLAGVKPVEPSMMPQGEILPTVKPTQILGKTLEQRLAEIESSTNSTEDFDEGLGRELGDTPRDNMIKRLSPTIMDQDTLMKSVAKVINNPEFTSDTLLKIVDAGSQITHPVGKYLQKEFEELQYDLGRKYEDMPEEVAEQLIAQLKQRTQESVEEGSCGDCGGNPCECAMEETYDNTPEERVEPYDPNNMAHVINKVSSKDLASTPYQSASNPLSESPAETKKVDEDVYRGLFKAYQEFKNSQ